MTRRLAPALLSCLLACSGSSEQAWDRPVAFSEVRRVVTLGDNVGANPSFARSYVALLGKNNDMFFPAFTGKDFTTVLPGSKLVRADRGGASFTALADAKTAVCTCTGASCGTTCVDTKDDSATLLIVQLGGNDLFQLVMRMLNDDALRMDHSAAATAFRAAVKKVLAISQDHAVFHRKPMLLVTNVYDPSDGVGDVAKLATKLFPVQNVEKITPELALGVIAEFNGIIEDEAKAAGGLFVDVHAAFLGHGLHSSDKDTPHYDADDATSWLRSVVDPNLRGAHEIRRAIWAKLTGEGISAIPMNLPTESTLDLPPVPDNGWAKVVVDSDITQELEGENGPMPNVAADPDLALGKPESMPKAVALGDVGKYIVVDMGEGTEVTDGDGDDFEVLEQGAASGGTPEPYRVYVAESAEGPFVTVADGMGERAFDLSPTGIKKARYVKVESLALAYDILHGFGSPYYPGPEIDAVGAIYPGGAK